MTEEETRSDAAIAPGRGPFAGLTRTVFVLGAASFWTDAASEMIAPVRSLFLVLGLGTPLPLAGLIAGLAESTASLLKILSGRLAGRSAWHRPLIVGGYGVSAAVKPLLALVEGPGPGLRIPHRAGATRQPARRRAGRRDPARLSGISHSSRRSVPPDRGCCDEAVKLRCAEWICSCASREKRSHSTKFSPGAFRCTAQHIATSRSLQEAAGSLSSIRDHMSVPPGHIRSRR